MARMRLRRFVRQFAWRRCIGAAEATVTLLCRRREIAWSPAWREQE
jgi:hypothetical protein